MSGRLYRTVDGDIVEEGDPSAAFLVVGEDGEVPEEYADAVKTHRSKGTKKAAPTENKAVRSTENKKA